MLRIVHRPSRYMVAFALGSVLLVTRGGYANVTQDAEITRSCVAALEAWARASVSYTCKYREIVVGQLSSDVELRGSVVHGDGVTLVKFESQGFAKGDPGPWSSRQEYKVMSGGRMLLLDFDDLEPTVPGGESGDALSLFFYSEELSPGRGRDLDGALDFISPMQAACGRLGGHSIAELISEGTVRIRQEDAGQYVIRADGPLGTLVYKTSESVGWLPIEIDLVQTRNHLGWDKRLAEMYVYRPGFTQRRSLVRFEYDSNVTGDPWPVSAQLAHTAVAGQKEFHKVDVSLVDLRYGIYAEIGERPLQFSVDIPDGTVVHVKGEPTLAYEWESGQVVSSSPPFVAHSYAQAGSKSPWIFIVGCVGFVVVSFGLMARRKFGPRG